MSKRILWVDVVKGLLILTVILGHAIQEPLKVRGISFEDNIWRNIIYSFHMPAFMAMSGYLMYRPNGVSNYWSSICNKFKQLIIPFFVWSIPLFLFIITLIIFGIIYFIQIKAIGFYGLCFLLV